MSPAPWSTAASINIFNHIFKSTTFNFLYFVSFIYILKTMSTNMHSEVNKLECIFAKARAYFSGRSDAAECMAQLGELEQFMECEGYDAELDDEDMLQLERDFVARQQQQQEGQCAEMVTAHILKLLVEFGSNSPLDLLRGPLFRKLQALEGMGCRDGSGQPLKEWMVTCHDGSGQPLNEYSVWSPLMAQCRESGKVAVYEKMQRYLVQYEHTVARPLPKTEEEPLSVGRLSDNINIVLSYMTEINSALHRMVKRRAFPLQIDVLFVAPGFHQKLR